MAELSGQQQRLVLKSLETILSQVLTSDYVAHIDKGGLPPLEFEETWSTLR